MGFTRKNDPMLKTGARTDVTGRRLSFTAMIAGVFRVLKSKCSCYKKNHLTDKPLATVPSSGNPLMREQSLPTRDLPALILHRIQRRHSLQQKHPGHA